jgi:hypothetical protein
MRQPSTTQGHAAPRCPGKERIITGVLSLCGLSALLLLAGFAPARAQTGQDPRCTTFTGQAHGLCTAAVSEGCFDGVESQECEDLLTNWMENCSQCAEVSPPWTVATCDTPGGSCLVFLTSQTYTGDLGGLLGADAECQALADAAGLSGAYKAWLSDSTTAARDRLTQATVPYVRVDGTVVANSFTDLVDGMIMNPILLTEMNTLGTSSAWTGTQPDGSATQANCQNWTSGAFDMTGTGGTTQVVSGLWTDFVDARCFSTAGLYCFEQ